MNLRKRRLRAAPKRTTRNLLKRRERATRSPRRGVRVPRSLRHRLRAARNLQRSVRAVRNFRRRLRALLAGVVHTPNARGSR